MMSPLAGADLPTPKAAVGVANILRRRIVTGQVQIGASLPAESQLLGELHVSRPTLRAALRILESEQLITVRRGSRGGAWVNAPTADVMARRAGIYMQYHHISLDEVYRAQAVIEPPAVRILAERAERADITVLEALLDRERGVMEDRIAFRSAALCFHRALVELAGSRMLTVFASMIHGVIEEHIERHEPAGTGRYRLGAERYIAHGRLVERIRFGKVDEAMTSWAAHLDATRPMLLKEDGANTLIDLLS